MPPVFRLVSRWVCGLGCCAALQADPLSESFKIDFFRDVPSRNLQGLATRSDGRLIKGPVLRPLTGELAAPLLWAVLPLSAERFLLGTGPDGRILEITLAETEGTFTSRDWGKVDDGQVFALLKLPDGRVLAGTSPRGGLHLLDDGEVVASVDLPADSVFDLLPDGDHAVLVATGNPGRILRVDVDAFAAAGVQAEPLTETTLSAHGIEPYGRIRDRNVRRLARAADGAVLAGSAPAGKVYRFSGDSPDPEILVDQTRAEVTDLKVTPEGDVFALVVHAGGAAPTRITRPTPQPTEAPPPTGADPEGEAPTVERFSGRSSLLWLPGTHGFPETLASRNNLALYRMATRGDLFILAGGDAGEIIGYDRAHRRSLTFGGSSSAQVSDLLPLASGRYLAVGNNPAALALLDFDAAAPRQAETRRLDLRTPATFGALRFNRLRAIEPSTLDVSLRSNRADDEVEGWSRWQNAQVDQGGWTTADFLRGRYAQLRLTLPAGVPDDLEIDAATLYHLPQNRRPALQTFRIISPNFGLIPRVENTSNGLLTLGQIINGEGGPGEKRSAAILGSQVVPQPGAQIVYWTLEDPDGDNLVSTFSIRRDDSDEWVDLAVENRESWLQFDRTHLPDGIYFTRLVVREDAPRAPQDRLEVTVATDDLVIDQTAPQIGDATVERTHGHFTLRVTGEDQLSLLAGVELGFNNGHQVAVEQPVDGILDGRAETFQIEVPSSAVTGATSVEILLYDATGNRASRRLPLP